MRPPLGKPINLNAIARKVDVDNHISLRNYFRIADNLLRQASIYREEKNVVDLYIILLRYSSLVSETIPFHRDYQVLLPKERTVHRKKLSAVMDELESLKPEYQRIMDDLNKACVVTKQHQLDGLDRACGSEASSLPWPSVNTKASLALENKRPISRPSLYSWKQNSGSTQVLSSDFIDKQFQKLSHICFDIWIIYGSFGLPLPNKETLSRHSFLGPNGLQGSWMGPSAEIKVQYPSNTDLTSQESLGLNQAQNDLVAVKDGDLGVNRSTMESVLSLDDGRWLSPTEESCSPWYNEAMNDHPRLGNISQPSPPPVLVQIQPEFSSISPSRVADPRPGPVKPVQNGTPSSTSYQHLHIPVKMMEDFLRLARENTAKNLETCGVLAAGSLKNRVFHITTLIVPKQESTSDSCQTLNEEENFEVQDKCSLFPLGWIHTHPSQTCFMSSVDLHTHYSYQIMLPEAIAIVMAPNDESSPHGIFHLSDPSGVSIIRNCQQRGFHPHKESEDGNPIYEHCSRVYMR